MKWRFERDVEDRLLNQCQPVPTTALAESETVRKISHEESRNKVMTAEVLHRAYSIIADKIVVGLC